MNNNNSTFVKPEDVALDRDKIIDLLTTAKDELAQVKDEYAEPVSLWQIEMSVGLVLQDICRLFGLSEEEVMNVMGEDYAPLDD